MADYQLFPAKVVTPEGVAFDGEVQEIEVSSVSGGLGILARRAPIVADLKVGRIRAMLEDGSWKVWASQEGFAQASNSTATIVVEDAILVDSIDKAQLAEQISEAKMRLDEATKGDDAAETRAAERALAWNEHLQKLVSE